MFAQTVGFSWSCVRSTASLRLRTLFHVLGVTNPRATHSVSPELVCSGSSLLSKQLQHCLSHTKRLFRFSAVRNGDIQEFDSKWDGILLSMTKIPPDDILEGLYKLRIRESEKLKTVLELYDLETHQKKLGPDYHRLKAMVKRSIE